jgi:hypothetical protein
LHDSSEARVWPSLPLLGDSATEQPPDGVKNRTSAFPESTRPRRHAVAVGAGARCGHVLSDGSRSLNTVDSATAECPYFVIAEVSCVSRLALAVSYFWAIASVWPFAVLASWRRSEAIVSNRSGLFETLREALAETDWLG